MAQAQLTLDDFNTGTTNGTAVAGSTWATPGNLTYNATSMTVGGTAKDDAGLEFNAPGFMDGTGFDQISVTALVDPSNTAANFVFVLTTFGAGFEAKPFQVAMTSFTSTLSTINIPIDWTGLTQNQIIGWTFGGGNPAADGSSPLFRMTIDNIALTSTSPVPEPSTYAALAGALALGVVFWRRRQTGDSV